MKKEISKTTDELNFFLSLEKSKHLVPQSLIQEYNSFLTNFNNYLILKEKLFIEEEIFVDTKIEIPSYLIKDKKALFDLHNRLPFAFNINAIRCKGFSLIFLFDKKNESLIKSGIMSLIDASHFYSIKTSEYKKQTIIKNNRKYFLILNKSLFT